MFTGNAVDINRHFIIETMSIVEKTVVKRLSKGTVNQAGIE